MTAWPLRVIPFVAPDYPFREMLPPFNRPFWAATRNI